MHNETAYWFITGKTTVWEFLRWIFHIYNFLSILFFFFGGGVGGGGGKMLFYTSFQKKNILTYMIHLQIFNMKK